MTQPDASTERLIEVYRKKAKHYDITSRLYPFPGYPVRRQRRAAVAALGLRPGATVVDIACGTGLNFPMIEQAIGPAGRLIGVDMTDAMLARAEQRIGGAGWSNVSLEQACAGDYAFPDGIDAILSTYAMTQVPDCAAVIARGAAALSDGGRWVVLDVKPPAAVPRWLTRLGTGFVRHFAAIDQWLVSRPWETIRAAMKQELVENSWTELCFGTAFLATGRHVPASKVSRN